MPVIPDDEAVEIVKRVAEEQRRKLSCVVVSYDGTQQIETRFHPETRSCLIEGLGVTIQLGEAEKHG